jgi:predicted dehydrogenase
MNSTDSSLIKQPSNLSRRQFVRRAATSAFALGAFPTLIPSSALGRDGALAPNERITVAVIGTGPQGRGDMGGFLANANAQVVAVCDVKKDQLEIARKQVNDRYQNQDCRTYGDFREVLARKDIDAVLVATPDQWHVPIGIAAVNAGKDLYLEKPMGLTLAEDQLLRKAVLKRKRIFQFGTQQRSSREFQRAVELVRNGRIGKLQEIFVWAPASRPGGSTTPAPVPENINYDLWLGPAPATPYTAVKCTDTGAKTWWFTTDYALGWIAGWGVHPLDIALWGHPAMMQGAMEIEGKGLYPKEGACNTAVAWDVNFAFADGVKMQFRGTPNGLKEPTPLTDFSPWRSRFGLKDLGGHGTLFVGSEGWVEVHRGGLRTSPDKLAEEPLPDGGWRSPKSNSHQGNFLECICTRQSAICPIEGAVQADTLCQLSDIAARLERKLTFDPKKETFVKDKEANNRLDLPPQRRPWRL